MNLLKLSEEFNMLVIISPSKTLTLGTPYHHSNPIFNKDAEILRTYFKKMSKKSIMTFFNISKAVAEQTQSYFLNDETYKVIDTFTGIQFKTLFEFEKVDMRALYVASGLYGLLHAHDHMKPYRMDLYHPKIGSVKDFYLNKIKNFLKHQDRIFLCVSHEYEKLFHPSLPLTFIQIWNGNKKASSVDAKKLRGAFAHYLLKHHGQSIEAFEYLGYKVIENTNSQIIIKK
jgi:cytoplasmic iron level regulating protein YaaA (DUF328/UPF0246 family)